MRKALSALLACGALLAVAGPASAADPPATECSAPATVISNQVVYGDVIVRPGAICRIEDSTVHGSVLADPDTRGILLARSTVHGELSGVRTNTLRIEDRSTVFGGVEFDTARVGGKICDSTVYNGVRISNFSLRFIVGDAQRPARDGSPECKGNTLYGDIVLERNSGFMITDENTIYGNAIARENTGTVEFVANTIFGNLICESNAGTVQGGGNRVSGNQTGQCAGFEPGFPD
jgi:hypothetical protein